MLGALPDASLGALLSALWASSLGDVLSTIQNTKLGATTGDPQGALITPSASLVLVLY